MKTLHLFAGAGGGIIADMMMGHEPVAAVEIDPFCRDILKARQKDGWLPDFEIFEDVRKFDGKQFRGKVDCVCGGFPCQDISVAGRGEGIHGERSGLFFELARIVSEVGPDWVFLENSPAIITRGIDTLLGTMDAMGYDSRWCVLSASSVGAFHKRERWWGMFSHRDCQHREKFSIREPAEEELSRPDELHGKISNTENKRFLRRFRELQTDSESSNSRERETFNDCRKRRDIKPGMGGMVDGLASRMYRPGNETFWTRDEQGIPRITRECQNRRKRLKAIGNGQVPACAVAAFQILMMMYQ